MIKKTFKNISFSLLSIVLAAIVFAAGSSALPKGDGTPYIKFSDAALTNYKNICTVPVVILMDEEVRAIVRNDEQRVKQLADSLGSTVSSAQSYFKKHFNISMKVDKTFPNWNSQTSSSVISQEFFTEVVTDYQASAYYKERAANKTAGEEIVIAFTGQSFSGDESMGKTTTVIGADGVKLSVIIIDYKEAFVFGMWQVLQHELCHVYGQYNEHYLSAPNRICVLNNDETCYDILCKECYDIVAKNRTKYGH